jgi:5-methylcytosine-specific restriction endonuclease McrA
MPNKIPSASSPRSASAQLASEDRAEANRFYASAAWRRLRAFVLAGAPLCVDCQKRGRITPATEVHHLEERRDRPDLALNSNNMEALCKVCHLRKRRGHSPRSRFQAANA